MPPIPSMPAISPDDAGQLLHWLLIASCLILYGTVRRLDRTVVRLRNRVESVASAVEFPEGPEGGEDTGSVIVGNVPVQPPPAGANARVDPDEVLTRWRENHGAFGTIRRGGFGQ